MRVLLARLAAAGAALALAGVASGASLPWSGLTVGVNDDAGKLDATRDWFYPALAAEGMHVNTLTLTWDDYNPTAIPAQAPVANAIAAAQANGITVELDLYPAHSQALTDGRRCKPLKDPEGCGDTARIQQFAAWTALVAQAFPTVHQFVVMNECNQPLFVNPQWDASGQNQSAEICGRTVAAAYDALKAADPTSFVWGVGLSPRGNDNASATTNSSTSPVRFVGYLGAWFKAFAAKTHRTAPLMDGFDYHPYPVPQSLAFATGYPQPVDASVSNLPRIYAAFYAAFAGSPQRTIGQQAGGGLPVSLNETGIQTATPYGTGLGTEVSATSAGGVLGQWATQAYQAKWYVQMLNLVACDPNVRLVNVFHLLDEADLAGWQSGLFFSDETPKSSAAAVQAWLATTGATCQGAPTPWTPAAPAATPVSPVTSKPPKSAKLKKPGKAKPGKSK
jgi:hypothetical protein